MATMTENRPEQTDVAETTHLEEIGRLMTEGLRQVASTMPDLLAMNPVVHARQDMSLSEDGTIEAKLVLKLETDPVENWDNEAMTNRALLDALFKGMVERVG